MDPRKRTYIFIYRQEREGAVKVLLFTMFTKQPNRAVMSVVQPVGSSSVENLSDAWVNEDFNSSG